MSTQKLLYIIWESSVKLLPSWSRPHKMSKRDHYLRYLVQTNLTHYKYILKHNPKNRLPF